MRVLLALAFLLVVAVGPLGAAVAHLSPASASPAPVDAAAPVAPQDGAAPVPASGGTALITIDREIDDGESEYLARAIAQASAAHCARVIIHFQTPGGTVIAAQRMLSNLLALADPRPRLIALVDDHCYSGGAMVAYGCDEIWLSRQATIGDIGVIQIKADGSIEYAPEKIESVVRAVLRSAAESRGWDAAKLQKMTARNQELYRFDLGHGDQVFVLSDDLPQFLADHPTVDEKSKVLIAGADRLLVYTGQDAVAEHMATGIAATLPDLEARLHVDPATVLDLSPTATETTAWALSGWAPLLAAGVVLFLVLEFKFGGTGLFLILAGLCAVAFFACQYYQALASYPEVLLMLVGVILIGLELFVFPTAGWLLMAGTMLAVLGLILAFMPNDTKFEPSSPLWSFELGHAFVQSLLAIVLIVVGLVVVIMSLPKMRLLTVDGAITATAADRSNAENAHLIGAKGVARTPLSPTGSIRIVDRDISATCEQGQFLPAGAEVEVVALRFGGAVVRPSPSAGATTA